MNDLVALAAVVVGASLFYLLAERHSLWAGLTALLGAVVVGSLFTGSEPLRWSVAKVVAFLLVAGAAWLARTLRRRRSADGSSDATTDGPTEGRTTRR